MVSLYLCHLTKRYGARRTTSTWITTNDAATPTDSRLAMTEEKHIPKLATIGPLLGLIEAVATILGKSAKARAAMHSKIKASQLESSLEARQTAEKRAALSESASSLLLLRCSGLLLL